MCSRLRMYSKFGKDSSKGKMIMSQAVVIKVLSINITDCDSIKIKSPWLFDIIHSEYGKIYIKQSALRGIGYSSGYRFQIKKKLKIIGSKKERECDTYFFLGFDENYNNIDRVYIVPNRDWVKDIGTVTIYNSADDSKYDKFNTDPKLYNKMYQDLMSFIKCRTVISIGDVKEWLTTRS